MTTKPDTLAQLSAAGVAVWLDDISRERLTTGNLAALMRDDHVVGVTSNPTIFADALAKGSCLRRPGRRPGGPRRGRRGGGPGHHDLRHPVGL